MSGFGHIIYKLYLKFVIKIKFFSIYLYCVTKKNKTFIN